MTFPRRVVLGAALATPAVLRRAWAQANQGNQAPANPVQGNQAQGNPAQGNPVPLGALYPFSGVLAQLGDESYRGLELAVDERNGAGGLLGRPIRLVKGDAVDPNAAVAEARRLTTAEKVGAIFGTSASALVFAASQVSELAGTPYFELGAISDAVTERGFRYLFRSCPLASAFAAVGIDALTGALAPLWGVPAAALKLAILYEDGLYGATVSGLQMARCKELGLNVVEKLPYSAATSDLGSAVQRLRGAETDVVLHTGYQNDVVLFFRQLRQVGWLPRMVIGSGGGYSLADTASAVGSDFDGAINVAFTPYDVNEAAAPGVREVEAAYQRKYGAKPRSGHSLANFVGGRLFLDAIARAGALDKDRVRAAALAIDLPVGATATGWGARFDEKGQNTRARPYLLQWQGGVQRTVLPTEASVAMLRPTLGG